MAGEQSQEKPTAGTLYIIGLPIGNPEDVTLRALRLLEKVDIVASKDPPHTQRFLRHHGIQALVTTYDRRHAPDKMPILLHRLQRGSTVALVSDRGLPCLYDPGSLLIAHAHRAGIPIITVPGPSALTAAVAIAGMSGDALYFHGRFPTSEARGMRLLATIKVLRCTTVLFVVPERLRQVLTLIERCLGNRQILIAVNLTQPTERVVRGKVAALLGKYALRYPGADVTVVVAGR